MLKNAGNALRGSPFKVGINDPYSELVEDQVSVPQMSCLPPLAGSNLNSLRAWRCRSRSNGAMAPDMVPAVYDMLFNGGPKKYACDSARPVGGKIDSATLR